ncbi:hypothetical protein LTR17_023345 [Elasticomyces elasticus]|nr:hypothetical protein LTR17_023345 [Elasticomyces elasticus]
MLHWLAGSKQPEGSIDPDATGHIDMPETPAPVFAVRAFKQAIFGTPQTVQAKPRRNSNNDHARSRSQGTRLDRPQMVRPKSSGDTRLLARDDEPAVLEPIASPTKGILMTPGTAATKRKTVTFGEHLEDKEEKRPTKSGLPDDFPGKFPSPWVSSKLAVDLSRAPADSSRGRSKLTEALEQVRDESAKKAHKRSKSKEDDEVDGEPEEPLQESAVYWKTQYDVYRDNSQREIKKLITKQKAAKSFAKEKDWQCTELADELRQERKKVEKLERKTVELEAQLYAMREQLKQQDIGLLLSEATIKTEAFKSRAARTLDTLKVDPATTSVQAHVENSSNPTTDPLLEPRTSREPVRDTVPEQEESKTAIDAARPKARVGPINIRTKTSDDIWNHSVNSPSPVITRSTNAPTSPKTGRAVTSGTGATPLMSLSVNSVPTASLVRRDSALPSPTSDRFSKQPLVRQEVPRSARAVVKPTGSPLLSPDLPLPLSESVPVDLTAPQPPTPQQIATKEVIDDVSMPMPASSPFQTTPIRSAPGATTKMSYFDRVSQRTGGVAELSSTKENVAPALKEKTSATDAMKPTAAWNSMNAPNVGKRVTNLTDKSGKEVGLERIEAAKARMAARGRVLS